jgi:hypothetical protein
MKEVIDVHEYKSMKYEKMLGTICINRLVVEISNPPTVRRRLKRQWPSDLPQPADDKR